VSNCTQKRERSAPIADRDRQLALARRASGPTKESKRFRSDQQQQCHGTDQQGQCPADISYEVVVSILLLPHGNVREMCWSLLRELPRRVTETPHLLPCA